MKTTLLSHLIRCAAVRAALRKEVFRVVLGLCAGIAVIVVIRLVTGKPLADGLGLTVAIFAAAAFIAWLSNALYTFRTAIREWEKDNEQGRCKE